MTPDTAEIVERAFAALKHGDAEHQAWLRDALDCFFNGRPVPAPRGSGNKEALIEALTAENERMRAHIAEQIEHAETRIRDGEEHGASIWRIALGDIARENRQALSNTRGRG